MKKVSLLVILFFVGLAFFIIPSNVAAYTVDNNKGERLIVKFRSLTPKFYRERIINTLGLNDVTDLRLGNTFLLRVSKDARLNIIENLERNPFVDYVEPDFVAYTTEVPNDPEFPNQWGLTKVNATGAWDKTHGANNVSIAIIDTGVDGSHPDISGKITASVDCTISSSCPNVTAIDANGHGTHVAGIAGAVTNNNTGIAGSSWESRLMSVRALDANGSGYYSWIANAIIWATDNGAKVINMSLSGSRYSRTLRNAVNYAWSNGVVVVAAAGNSSSSYRSYPAYFSNSIAVAATDENDNKAYFSTYGSWVDVAAPGVSIISTYQGGYEHMSGTSMAAPHVAGLAALVFGQNPGWSNSQVRDRIESSADVTPGTGSYWEWGRVNYCNAVNCEVVEELTPTPTNTPTPTLIPTVSPTSSPTPTVTSTPTPTPTETTIPTNTPTNTPTPAQTLTPTPSQLPWWCRYVPRHYLCQ